MVKARIVEDNGGHLTVLIVLTSGQFSRSFEGQGHFFKLEPLFFTPDSKKAENFTLKMIFGFFFRVQEEVKSRT